MSDCGQPPNIQVAQLDLMTITPWTFTYPDDHKCSLTGLSMPNFSSTLYSCHIHLSKRQTCPCSSSCYLRFSQHNPSTLMVLRCYTALPSAGIPSLPNPSPQSICLWKFCSFCTVRLKHHFCAPSQISRQRSSKHPFHKCPTPPCPTLGPRV